MGITMKFGSEHIAELVKRVVSSVSPLRIILFGSAGQGRMRANSDFDILVIVANGIHRRRAVQSIYRGLAGFGIATDVIVATVDDIKKYGENFSLIYQSALQEGREIYHAA